MAFSGKVSIRTYLKKRDKPDECKAEEFLHSSNARLSDSNFRCQREYLMLFRALATAARSIRRIEWVEQPSAPGDCRFATGRGESSFAVEGRYAVSEIWL
jgi:hypothetical protein